MVKNLIKTLLLVAVAATMFGCGAYSQLLRSNDPDKKYTQALKYFDKGKYKRTIALLEEISHIYSNTPREDTVAFYIGYAYYKDGKFDMSGIHFDNFRKTHGRSPFLEQAEYMYAKGFYFMSPEPNRDQTATRQAMMAIDEYMGRYPNSVKKESLEQNMKDLMQKLYDKAFINAKVYYTIENYKSAVVALKNALTEYPETNHREELMYLIAKSNYLLASNSIESLQRDRYMDAVDAYYSFAAEYKDSKYMKELDKMLASSQKYLAKFSDKNNDNTIQENGD
jgi:outer membrane protein assembly factor BamD